MDGYMSGGSPCWNVPCGLRACLSQSLTKSNVKVKLSRYEELMLRQDVVETGTKGKFSQATVAKIVNEIALID